MNDVQQGLQQLKETINRIIKPIVAWWKRFCRTVGAVLRKIFRSLSWRMKRAGLLKTKPHAHKHKISYRRMQVYQRKALARG